MKCVTREGCTDKVPFEESLKSRYVAGGQM